MDHAQWNTSTVTCLSQQWVMRNGIPVHSLVWSPQWVMRNGIPVQSLVWSPQWVMHNGIPV